MTNQIPHWNNRKIDQTEYDQFVGKWLVDLKEQDLSNPSIAITNGWQAEHFENQWYQDEHKANISFFAYDSRGQGSSPKNGRLDAVQGAIDANYIITKAFDNYDKIAKERGVEPGNKILQGNCMGTLPMAALFAGKFPITKRTDGLILISPVSTFNLPWYLKILYFIPEWFGRFAIRYLAEPVTHMVAPGEESELSRNTALRRVYKLDIPAAIRQVKEIFWKEDVTKYWKYVDVPTLIIVGGNDPLTKIEESAEVYRQLKYPIWLELEAPDHLLLEDNIGYIKEFLPKFCNDPWKIYEEMKDIKPDY